MLKKKKKRIFQYSWLPIGTYYKNLTIWKKFSQRFPKFDSIFCMKNQFLQVKNQNFLGWNLVKICQNYNAVVARVSKVLMHEELATWFIILLLSFFIKTFSPNGMITISFCVFSHVSDYL
jgi:hypothetical protein